MEKNKGDQMNCTSKNFKNDKENGTKNRGDRWRIERKKIKIRKWE